MAHICSPLLALVQQQPCRTIASCEGRTATAAQLHDSVALLSWGLRHLLRLAPGQRVALVGLNSDALFAALLGVADAGCLAVPLHWRWSAREAAAALAATAPALLLADEACGELAAAAVAELQQQQQQEQQQEQTPLRIIQLTPGLLQHPALAAAAAAAGSWTRSNDGGGGGGSDGGRGGDIQTLAQLLTAAAEHHLLQQQQQPQRVALALAQAPGGGVLVAFTSGSTGAAKGALLTHAALMHQSLVKLAVVGFCRADVALHLPPLAHVGGLSSALAVLAAGGAHVFLPGYSGAAALQLMQQYQVTALIAVPAMMQDVVAAAAAAAAGSPAAAALPSLARVLVGAGGLAPQLAAAVRALFPTARLTTAYGMTEAASSITFISLQQQQQLMAATAPGTHTVCVGLPAPGVAVAIDPLALQQQQQQGSSCSSGAPTAAAAAAAAAGAGGAGVVGEVLMRGPQLMATYWGQPDATRQAVRADGWLRTGDLGCLDAAGRLWLAGRLGDVVRSGGESVAAAAVEAALLAHPGVAAAAVVGLPHARLGEQVAAAVVLRPGWSWTRDSDDAPPAASSSSSIQDKQQQQESPRSVSAAGLRAACRAAGLAGYKLPRVLAPLKQLPLTGSGKVAKPQLRQQLLALSLDGSSTRGDGGSGGPPCSRL